ncbi:MAG: hypothetical protein ABIF10_03935 [Candidatus Woesearchaeota archaeon]
MNAKFKFIVKIYKDAGITGEGKNSKYSFKLYTRELTAKQAESYIKRTCGAYAYVVSQIKKDGPEIWWTKRGVFAIENWSKGKFKGVILSKSFDKVLNFVSTKYNDEVVKIRISKIVHNPTPWAKKYKYNTDTE